MLESRLGGGSRRSAYLPGNVGITTDDAGGSLVVRRADWEDAVSAGVPPDRVIAWLAQRGRRTVYTPDTIVSSAPAPLFAPHLREAVRRGRARGEAARRTRGRSLSASTLFSLIPSGGSVALALLALDARIGFGSFSPRPWRSSPRRGSPRCGSSRCRSGFLPSPRSS